MLRVKFDIIYIIIELFFSFEVRAVLVPDTMRLGQLIYEINKK